MVSRFIFGAAVESHCGSRASYFIISDCTGVARRMSTHPSHTPRVLSSTPMIYPQTGAPFLRAAAGSGVKRVLDVRLNNASQLSGFAKRDDLALLPDKESVLP